ncbi:S-layer homology domain-containing protein [Anaerotalea alkaliphila]|uniref:S-layer homology domain-containing protein n=1 Tax=Anaerotalea alkaliphila TaxID=2662126 RepID=A0A7X5KPE4_9FIRM|nr:S-layer homology domain-containing protein [Anaerotalea alkaliphila]NDL67967.1 S-layer homology domain-containing protein [Anaerotalea alkaliphila]
MKKTMSRILALVLAMTAFTGQPAVAAESVVLTEAVVDSLLDLQEEQKETFVEMIEMYDMTGNQTGLAASLHGSFGALVGEAGQEKADLLWEILNYVDGYADQQNKSLGEILKNYFDIQELAELMDVDARQMLVNALAAYGMENMLATAGVTEALVAESFGYLQGILDLLLEVEDTPVFVVVPDKSSMGVNKSSAAMTKVADLLADRFTKTKIETSLGKLSAFYNANPGDRAAVYSFLAGYGLLHQETAQAPVPGGGGGGLAGDLAEVPGEEPAEESPAADIVRSVSALKVAATTSVVEGRTVAVSNVDAGILWDALVQAEEAIQEAKENGGDPERYLLQPELLLVMDVVQADKSLLELSAADLLAVEAAGAAGIRIASPLGSIRFSTANLQGLLGDASSIQVLMETIDPANVGLAPGAVVVDFKILVDNIPAEHFTGTVAATFAYTLPDGADPSFLAVYHRAEDGAVSPVGGRYRAKAKAVEFFTNHFSTFFVRENRVEFADVPGSHWANQYVNGFAAKGFIQGRDGITFDPEANVTRAEYVAMIARMYKLVGVAEESPFGDVQPEDWFAGAVAAAHQAGIIRGKSVDSFDPLALITREEAAVVVANALEYAGFAQAKTTELLDRKFQDTESIAAWAREAVATAVREGIINGRTQDTFVPKANATRAEAAKMLFQLYAAE